MRIFARLNYLGKVTTKSGHVIQLNYPFSYIYNFTKPDDSSLEAKQVAYRKSTFFQ